MTDREQIAQVCRWNRMLAGENCRLRARVRQVEQQYSDRGVELMAAQVLLGEAIDVALEGGAIVTRFVSTLAVVFLGVAAIAAVAPRLAVLVHELVPVILAAGTVAVVLRLVWFYTRR